MQTAASHCTTMHPPEKSGLQKGILAASVQDEVLQPDLSGCFGECDLKNRTAALEAKDVGKRAELLYLRSMDIYTLPKVK